MVTTTSRPLASWLHGHAWIRLVALLSAPMLWLVVAYLGSLATLLLSSLWTVNSFTGEVVRQPSAGNFETLLTEDVYRTVVVRTILVAAAVTVIDALIALPMALFM